VEGTERGRIVAPLLMNNLYIKRRPFQNIIFVKFVAPRFEQTHTYDPKKIYTYKCNYINRWSQRKLFSITAHNTI